MPSIPWVIAIVFLLVTSLTSGHLSQPDTLSLVLVGGMLCFELSCVPLPALGLFSAGAACSLALIVHAGGGLAALVACSVLGIRLAVKGQPGAAVIDLIPLLVCCLADSLLHGWGGVQWLIAALYLGTQSALLRHFAARLPRPEYVPWRRLQVLVQEMRLLVVLASLGLAQIPADHLGLLLLAVPLWATHRAVAYGVFRLHSWDASLALEALDDLQSTLVMATRETDQARRELRVSLQDRRLLEEMSHRLTSQPDPIQALDYVLEVCGRLGRYQTLAIFQAGPAGLTPLRYRGPHSARLESAPLLKLQEPLLELALQTDQAQLLRQDHSNRIFVGESAALVVPLGKQGVLYAGRPGPALTEAECRGLISLALRAGPLLQAAQLRYQDSRQLQQSQQHSQVLAGQVSLLTSLLECSQHLFSSLEGERLLDLCEEALPKLLPHHGGQIWLHSAAPSRQWGKVACGQGGDVIGPLVAAVVQSGKPLLLPSLSDGSGRSCLCAPFPPLQRQNIRGAVVLIHEQPDVFQREHQDALTLFVQQLALALANAAYLKQVIETQAQLVQSSKMTAVGQLAAGIAHELNSPLAAIALALESVGRTLDAPAAVKKLERAGASTERCRKIVEKLLIYTRLGSPVRERTELKALVEDTLDFFQTHLELDGYEVHLDLQAEVWVLAIAQELQQVVVGLLVNAKESYLTAPQLPKKIAISCGQSAGQGWVMVRDSGIGIAEEDLGRVFEPFFTNKTIGKNIGLGLSVGLEIVRQHGGDLVLKSAPGQGTAARLSLPLA